MNLNNIISEIEKIDPEVYDRLDNRRSAMQQFTKIGGKIALAAVPVALGGMFKKAYAGTGGNMKPSIVDVLNFALTLEYLEAGFYNKAVGTAGLITNSTLIKGFKDIQDDENAHVAFLTATIKALGGTPVAMPTFDYTAGGAFADVFSNVDTFYAVSQTFEDTGVRAYKGQAGNLMSSNDVLTAALQIHSVEARHASEVRRLRGLKGWISNAERGAGMPAATQAVYDGEGVTMQAGYNTASLFGAAAGSEAYDEPLTTQQVVDIANLFIV